MKDAMDPIIRIGIIGEFDANRISHTATNEALNHAAETLGLSLDVAWLQTLPLGNDSNLKQLADFDALWAAPGGIHKIRHGALRAIQFAREKHWPFIGT